MLVLVSQSSLNTSTCITRFICAVFCNALYLPHFMFPLRAGHSAQRMLRTGGGRAASWRREISLERLILSNREGGFLSTTKIWETLKSTYRIRCGVSGIVQGREARDLVRFRLRDAPTFVCFYSAHLTPHLRVFICVITDVS